MNRVLPTFLVLAIVCLFVTSCSSYRYACVTFGDDIHRPSPPVVEGKGKKKECSWLFDFPFFYIGPVTEIPSNATIYAALVVTYADQIRAIPLYKWKTDDDLLNFGCNGPHPKFAIWARDQNDFFDKIRNVVGQ